MTTLSAIAQMQLRERNAPKPDPACCCPTCGQPVAEQEFCRVNEEAGQAIVNGRSLDLLPKESAMLAALAKKFPNVATKGWLLDYIYPMEQDQPDIKVVDVVLHHLRRKLEGTGAEIVTHWGMGVRLKRRVD